MTCRELGLTYRTASRYPSELAGAGLLENEPVGRHQFYLSRRLLELFNQQP